MSTPAPPVARPVPGEIDPRHYLLERYAGGGERSALLRAYYAVRPALPRALQLALRRRYARRQARRTFPAWPIEPLLVEDRTERLRAELRASGAPRLPLPGLWPGGAAFAAVLTHDVEGPAGVANIPRVLEVEARHGIVSSWNFVADWYPIPDGTFDRVRAAGGEIGLHGIKHDGRLFSDRAHFEADLPRIHEHLERWGAVGFRSPATHRNADWMPELGCLYDSSFPDTDPFEPQSGGCCSIWPFLLGDLVELPITLVQDHTMWEILRREDIDLWTQKTDWIAAQGGLVNLILHPDYVLDDEHLGRYDRYLAHLRGRLDADGGWHALPRDVAGWWKGREALDVAPDGTLTGPEEARSRAVTVWAREEGSELVVEHG